MLEVRDLRNIEKAALCLDPGLNVLEGRNAQGKTSILEAVAFLSRGRSFRTDEAALAIRRGAPGLAVRGDAEAGGSSWSQRMELCGTRRVFELDGREVGPGEYGERLEAVVYSNDRIRALQSSSRERRAYIDRGGARLWPGYRQALREYDKTLAHRNAALKQDARDLPAWNDQLALAGGALRHRRGEYAARLCAALRDSEPLTGELVTLAVGSEAPVGSAAAESEDCARRWRRRFPWNAAPRAPCAARTATRWRCSSTATTLPRSVPARRAPPCWRCCSPPSTCSAPSRGGRPWRSSTISIPNWTTNAPGPCAGRWCAARRRW